jgi:hypothetical protein
LGLSVNQMTLAGRLDFSAQGKRDLSPDRLSPSMVVGQ